MTWIFSALSWVADHTIGYLRMRRGRTKATFSEPRATRSSSGVVQVSVRVRVNPDTDRRWEVKTFESVFVSSAGRTLNPMIVGDELPTIHNGAFDEKLTWELAAEPGGLLKIRLNIKFKDGGRSERFDQVLPVPPRKKVIPVPEPVPTRTSASNLPARPPSSSASTLCEQLTALMGVGVSLRNRCTPYMGVLITNRATEADVVGWEEDVRDALAGEPRQRAAFLADPEESILTQRILLTFEDKLAQRMDRRLESLDKIIKRLCRA